MVGLLNFVTGTVLGDTFSLDLQLHSRGTKTDVNVSHMLIFAATIAGKVLFRQLDISPIFKKIV